MAKSKLNVEPNWSYGIFTGKGSIAIKPKFSNGDKIIVRDKSNFYYGRTAEVVKKNTAKIYQVKIDRCYFPLTEDEMETT